MSKALQLEKQLQLLADEVKDLFHATKINLQALSVEVTHKNSSKELVTIIEQSQNNLDYLQSLLDQRSNLRLNYLITEQIKEEEAKVRRERLNDYEEKILDQRRLISDKEAFYENLLRPKKKRPQNMPMEEFQQLRRRQIAEDESRKYKWLKEEVDRLGNMYTILKQENIKMKKQMKQEQQRNQEKEVKNDLAAEIISNPTLYDNLGQSSLFTEIKKDDMELFKSLQSLREENEVMIKEYFEEKQMYQYLKWENKKLIEQYKQQQSQLKQMKVRVPQKPTKLFERPVSR